LTRAYSDFQNNKSNDYLDFMKECKLKEQQLLGQKRNKDQKHHIVPRHHYKNHKLDFSHFNNPENLIKLSFP